MTAFSGDIKSILQHSGLLPEPTFDSLLEHAPTWFDDCWAAVLESAQGRSLYDSTVFLVGPMAGEFHAYQLASEHHFEPQRVDGLFVVPAAQHYRPSTLEADRIRRDERSQVPDIQDLIDTWEAMPVRPVPIDIKGWALVALEARTRATQDFAKTLVGGSLYFTNLKVGSHTTMKVFDFDDTGEELLKLVGFTQHPAAQERPCWCESGKRHIDCHQAPDLDEPCGCGVSKTFRECCAVTV